MQGELPGPRWNIAPTDPVAVICRRPDAAGNRQTVARTMRWGMVPSWSKSPTGGRTPLINARCETLSEKPSWRRPFQRRRCLVPADGYYEWTRGPGGSRQPWYLHRPDRATLALAGIYDFWRDRRFANDDPRGWLASVAIITTAADDDLGRLHDRMPVVLDASLRRDWMVDDDHAPELLAVAADAMSGLLTGTRVAPLVNRVGVEGPELIEPVGE